jgi:predicted XRE-type DNA-binding protein
MAERLEREEQIATTPPVPKVELEDIVADQQLEPEIQALIARCMEGTEPYERELKSWEMQKFSPMNVTTILMMSAGFRQKQVAEILGIEQHRISVTVNHPYGRKLLHALMHRQSGRVLDIRTRMETFAGDILDKMYKDAMQSEDLKIVSSIGFAMLDRAGYAPAQNINVNSKSVNVSATTDPATLSRIANALEESNSVDRFIMPTRPKSLAPAEGRSVGTSEPPPARDDIEVAPSVVSPRAGDHD